MKFSSRIVVALTAAWLVWAPCILAQQTPPPAVRQAAVEGLQPFLAKIPAPQLDEFGFGPTDPVGDAVLGEPFRVHTISPAALSSYQAGQPVRALLEETELWYFPVLLNGQCRAVLVVDRLDNRYQAVSLGYARLATELGILTRQWKAAQGFRPVLAICYQARQHLFTVPEKGANNLTRLVCPEPGAPGAAAPAPRDYSTLEPVSGTVDQLKAELRHAAR